MSEIIEFEPGCRGKAHRLQEALMEVIWDDRFEDVTLAEVVGALELVKFELIYNARTDAERN